jgi:hypothetical protein
MKNGRVAIKELEMDIEVVIRILKCLKQHEPDIWKLFADEASEKTWSKREIEFEALCGSIKATLR